MNIPTISSHLKKTKHKPYVLCNGLNSRVQLYDIQTIDILYTFIGENFIFITYHLILNGVSFMIICAVEEIEYALCIPDIASLCAGGWKFRTYDDHCIAGYNQVQHRGLNLQECFNICLSQVNYFCRSFDWHPGSNSYCNLASHWTGSVPLSAVRSPCNAGAGWTIYERVFDHNL